MVLLGKKKKGISVMEVCRFNIRLEVSDKGFEELKRTKSAQDSTSNCWFNALAS
jgi:hypothetical protein